MYVHGMIEKAAPHSFASVLKRLEEAGTGPKVTVSEIVDAVGQRAFAPLLLIPALLVVSPASGIPGVSTVVGIMITLISAQIVFRRKSVWLPEFLRRRTISRRSLHGAVRFLEKPAGVIDRYTYRRLAFLTEWPFDIVPAIICLGAGLIMPFFEFVPFTSSILGAAVGLFSLALVTSDGVLVLIGLGLLAGAGSATWSLAA